MNASQADNAAAKYFMNVYSAYAKVNIGLDVTGIRADGYHLLDTVMQEISLADRLELVRISEGIRIECSDSKVPLGEDNLITRAIRLLGADGIYIRLEKNIPMQAGLGGGSSDAAAALKAVNEVFGLGHSNEELKAFAVRLGADVPFFIDGGSARCRGIGDEIERLKDFKNSVLLKNRCIVICKPSANASTQNIYKKYDALDQSKIIHPDIDALINGDTSQMINVLEYVTGAEISDIEKTEAKLKDMGAVCTSMTGSGSAVFGIFEESAFADAEGKTGAQMINELRNMGGMICRVI